MSRVLVVPSFYPTAEAPLLGTFFRDHAEMLRRAGLDVDVVCVEMRSLRQFGGRSLSGTHFQTSFELEEGVRVARLHGWNPLAQTIPGGLAWAHLAAGFAIRHARRHGLPDLIHAHNALWGGEAARLASARLGVPFVITEHSSGVLLKSLSRLGASFARRVWKSARVVCAVSRALADAMEDYGITMVRVIANPIDTDFFTLPPDHYSIPRARHLLVVGNLVKGKRIDHLLRALQLSCSDGVWTRLDVVGGGAERARLVRLASALGLSDSVHFMGALDRSGVREAMWRAAGFVSSSSHETFGMAVAEALSTGLPVVATRSGGVDEILSAGVGTLVERDCVESLAIALRTTPGIDRPSRIRRREHVNRSYAGTVVASKYLSLYASV